MAEDIKVLHRASKTQKYDALLPQIAALVEGETNLTARAANICAALKMQFDFFWVGFYFVHGDELVLGPFQGPPACNRIAFGKGLCGSAWAEKRTLIVDDVEAFPGHIACSAHSKSEIVVPILIDGEVKAVLDVDSDRIAGFDDTDKTYLERAAALLFA